MKYVCCSGVSDKWGGIFFGFCKPKKFILQFVNNNEFGIYIVEVNISLSLITMSSVYREPLHTHFYVLCFFSRVSGGTIELTSTANRILE